VAAMRLAERLNKLSSYPFGELKARLKEEKSRERELIDFTIGDPDLPTPPFVIEELVRCARLQSNHKYPSSSGEKELREAIADWYKIRFGVDLDPAKEIISLIGSKEGFSNLIRACLDPGSKVLVPDPSYPAYVGSVLLADCKPARISLLEESNFMPDLPQESDAQMLILNYPNNPTGSVVELDFLEEVVNWTKANKLILCYDNAYSELTFDGSTAPSLLEIADSKSIGIEFNTCSKTFNMTGDRIGWAVGSEVLIGGLKRVKEQIDSGVPTYIQRAAIKALQSYSFKVPHFLEGNINEYRKRRDLLVEGLNSLGMACSKPGGTFFVWLKCPCDSNKFAEKLLKIGIAVTPGEVFGEGGKGWVRFSLTQPREKIKEALERISVRLETF
jgi:LL-diaminopimelate aminotransferase